MYILDTTNEKTYYMDKSEQSTLRVLDTEDWSVQTITNYDLACLCMQYPDLPLFNAHFGYTGRNLMNNDYELDQKKYNYYKKRNYTIEEDIGSRWTRGVKTDYTRYTAKVPTLSFSIFHNKLFGWWKAGDMIQFPDMYLWRADGMKVRGQSDEHLMIWYQDKLYIIDSGVLARRGQIFYRDSTNQMWLHKVIKDFDGISQKDYYFYLSFIEKVDNDIVFTLSGFDRYTGDWYQTTFNLSHLQGIPCPKGRIISKLIALVE